MPVEKCDDALDVMHAGEATGPADAYWAAGHP
jgi:hypothetical protein